MKSTILSLILCSSVTGLNNPASFSSKARTIYEHVWGTTLQHASEMSVGVEDLASSGTLLADVSAYGDGDEHCNLLYETMMRAEQEVLLGTYTFDRTSLCGRLARLAIERLNQRAKRVRIYALIDAFSQLNIWKQHPFKVPVDLRDIASDRRITRGSIFGLPDASSVHGVQLVVKTMHIGVHGAMHSKMLVVDGKWVVFGSKNWEALPAHEYSALMEGPIARSFRSDFQRLWDAPLPPLQPSRQDDGDGSRVPMLYLARKPASNFPRTNDHNAQDQAWIKAVQLAQRYILLMSPNVNTESFMDRLLEAIRRGVRVIIITNWSFHDFGEKLYPDSAGSNRDTFEYLRKRLRNDEERNRLTACYFLGRRVQPPRLLDEEIIHTKYLDVDGEFSIFGSGNFDPQSFYYSSEANVLLDDAAETRRITAKLFSQQQSLEHCFHDTAGRKEYNATLYWTPPHSTSMRE